jgi:hypothetical protein
VLGRLAEREGDLEAAQGHFARAQTGAAEEPLFQAEQVLVAFSRGYVEGAVALARTVAALPARDVVPPGRLVRLHLERLKAEREARLRLCANLAALADRAQAAPAGG